MKKKYKKVAVTALMVSALTTSVYASSDAHSAGVYIVPKAVVILGDTIEHDGHEYEGDLGYGLGVDLGYSFNKHFALEGAVTYAQADVSDGHDDASATYITYGVNAVGTYNISGHFNVIGKLGYAFEDEEISDFHVEETLDGITYALGCEYGINKNVELVAEFEGADVESTRGKSLLFGAKYKF